MNKEITDKFHIEYETSRAWEKISWLGIPMFKLPFDAFIIQELIFKVRPDYIIETGTAYGGSALFYASLLELLGNGRVITVDIEPGVCWKDKIAARLMKKRVRCFTANSTDPYFIAGLRREVRRGNKRVMVILDSWHTKEHVINELTLYSPLVSVGSYLIVEDSHVNGHPVPWEYGEGPYEAVDWFLQRTEDFVIDREAEKFELTFNPAGYLLRVK